MDEKRFLILKQGHSLTFLLLFLLNLFVDRLFLKYVGFKALMGAESEVTFDPFLFNWKLVNYVVLFINLLAAAGVFSSFWMKQAYSKFWVLFALVFLINLFYPSGMWVLEMPGFHFIPISVMLINGYGLLALVFLKRKRAPTKPADPILGVEKK